MEGVKATFEEGAYGLPDPMIHGLNLIRNQTIQAHPLEISEKKFDLSRRQMDFSVLQKVQGIHAPLRLTMERQAAAKIQRLPFMSSSHLMIDTLMGKDDEIGFEDLFTFESEKMVTPHVVMENPLNHH
ncbi:hypothetical protein CHUAL_012862 [Chamberlinius hualienensis]